MTAATQPPPLPELVGGRLLWTAREAARALGVSLRTFNRWEAEELPALVRARRQLPPADGDRRIKRYAVEELAEWVRRGCPRG